MRYPTVADALRLRNSIELHSKRLNQLLRNSDWRGQVFGYEMAKEEAILRSLLQLRLLIECVQILTPPLLTVTTNGTQLTKHAEGLFASGVRRINVSLDSLDPGGTVTIDLLIFNRYQPAIDALASREDGEEKLIATMLATMIYMQIK